MNLLRNPSPIMKKTLLTKKYCNGLSEQHGRMNVLPLRQLVLSIFRCANVSKEPLCLPSTQVSGLTWLHRTSSTRESHREAHLADEWLGGWRGSHLRAKE
jgi:hypothetical protein